jgi:N-acetylmuramate 1-kinase
MTDKNNERTEQLARWVATQVSLDKASASLTPIANDAGFRRYFRFASPSQWLAVDAPPATEDSNQFIALANYLSANGVATPRIYSADNTHGFLLVEDFGDELLHTQLNRATANDLYTNDLYTKAMTTLQTLQQCPDNKKLIPRYDQVLLRRELSLFSEWFVYFLLGHKTTSAEDAMLNQLFETLEISALAQPQTLVHRDFHSRNLLVREKNELGVIDFQGAHWGACSYDLVSLLRDCYVRWPLAQVKSWALDYREQAITAGILLGVSEAEFLGWFDLMGLQRHIKVLGIFSRLHLRDGKKNYLQDLPLVIRYTLEVAEQYPTLRAFNDWFKAKLLPLIEKQNWYSDYRIAGEKQAEKSS